MRYRPEIDGLRAVAVLPVVLFHAGVPGFGGGYVGVDVFFVISGFLITGLLLQDIQDDRFSILTFYERRARRILPALFVVMAACIPFAVALMLPGDIALFGRSVLAAGTFWSNILFWLETGYFAPTAEELPLLHTWSLSVEEQFYILFPLILLALVRWRRSWLVPGLLAMALASFALALWGARAWPVANFFLSPTRFWELLAGALCTVAMPKVRAHWLPAAAGLVMIAAAIAAYHGDLPFPSHYTLLPVAGTCLVLLFASEAEPVGRTLALRGPVAVGLVSYSLYLWHQPVLVFARMRWPDGLHWTALVALFALTGALAWLSWRFVERPFRQRDRVSRDAVFGLSLAAIGSFSALGAAVGYGDGWRTPYYAILPADRRAMVRMIDAERQANAAIETEGFDDGACVFSTATLDPETRARIRDCRDRFGPGVMVLGDSHGVDIMGVMVATAPEEPFVVGIVSPGCRPHGPLRGCPYADTVDLLPDGDFRAIVFSQAAFYLLRNADGNAATRTDFVGDALPFDGFTPHEKRIEAVVDYLETLAPHAPVLWLGPRLEPHVNVDSMAWRGCRYPYALRPGQRDAFARLDDAVAKRLESSPVAYVSQQDLVDLRLPEDLTDCEGLYFLDGDHYSAAGERRFGLRMQLMDRVRHLTGG
ncbi:acyltransferase family protein [Psychromarinibacter sp. S121]|uniref:acyltransferase family protein n=1 Tax=Psychromarinibacter sp. S121 TaxID=3415127 RepID=UPI003C7B16FF